jgi:hypothetical protein
MEKDNALENEKSFKMNRRTLLKAGGAGAVGLLAGCTQNNGQDNTQNQTDTDTEEPEEETETEEEPEQEYLSGVELHDEWIQGEHITARLENNDIDWDRAHRILDAEGDPTKQLAAASQLISQQYITRRKYEDRHRAVVAGLQKIVEEKDGEKWDIRIDSRLDATPSQTGWLKFSRIDIETDETTERGNTKYDTIRGVFTRDRDHTTYVRGEPEPGEPGTKQLLQQIDNPETHKSRSLIDKDALDEDFKNSDWDQEATYDQFGMNISILLGGGIHLGKYEDNYVTGEHLLVSEDGREQAILEIVDEYEEDGDIALRDRLREHYFNNGFDEYEATRTNITDEGDIEYMEGIDGFDMDEQVADV